MNPIENPMISGRENEGLAKRIFNGKIKSLLAITIGEKESDGDTEGAGIVLVGRDLMGNPNEKYELYR